MGSIPLKKYREREDERINKQQGWTGKESRKMRIEKEGRENEGKSEFIGLVYN